MADEKRLQRSFKPWVENEQLLVEADEVGINPADVINEALKRVGRKALQEIAADRVRKLRKLATVP